jgi:ankyrin repeat protein
MKLTKQILQKLIKEEYDNLYGKGYISTSTNNKPTTQPLSKADLKKLNKKLLNYSRKGDLNGVKQTIKNGADVNCKSNEGWTPLHWSSYWNRLDIVKYLIEHGADVNCKDSYGWTPLHWSSQEGYLDIVKYLIEYGADVNCESINGWTPLHRSSFSGHLNIVKHLIEHGADWFIKNKYNKYFIDYLPNKNKEIIIKKYPKQYEKFLANKK